MIRSGRTSGRELGHEGLRDHSGRRFRRRVAPDGGSGGYPAGLRRAANADRRRAAGAPRAATVPRSRSSRWSWPGPVSGLEVMRQLHETFGTDLPVILRLGRANCRTGPHRGTHARRRRLSREATRLGRASRAVSKRSVRRAGTSCQRTGTAHATRPSLSPREREILTLLAKGSTQGQIATALVISSKTVATHIQHILSKLGVHTRAQAVASGVQASVSSSRTCELTSFRPHSSPATELSPAGLVTDASGDDNTRWMGMWRAADASQGRTRRPGGALCD